MAVIANTSVGAQNGVLIKSAAVLEATTNTNHVFSDRTGTLTTEKMNVVEAQLELNWTVNK
jgi:P-type E1-E2 ATPase